MRAFSTPLPTLIVGLVVGILLVGPANAQSSEDLESLNKQIERLYEAGKYTEAVPLAERYVALARERHGGEHAELATALHHLAQLYRVQGRSDEAEPLYKQSLAIREIALGPDHPDVGVSLNDLAVLHYAQGRYPVAESMIKRGLVIRETALGPDHPDVGQSLANLAMMYQVQGRYADAEPLHKRALLITEKALGTEHRDLAQWLNNLAELYRVQGRYAEAEPLIKRALAVTEKALGPDHPDVGIRLNNLAVLYHFQGRHAEAEPLYKRALTITQNALGQDHAFVGQLLNNLAELYRAQGRIDELERLMKSALAVREKALGPDHPDVGVSVNNLALLYQNQGRYAEAEPLHKRTISIFEKALGPDHPDVALALNNLAALYDSQGRYADAEPLYRRSLAIREKALGPDHPDVGQSLNNLAWLHFVQRDWTTAAMYWQQGTDLLIRRSRRGTETLGTALIGRGKSDAELQSYQFRGLIKATHRLAETDRAQAPQLTRDMFKIAQWAQASEAGASLAQMSARQAKGDSALARLVRERQDLVGEWQTHDKNLIAARTQPPDKRDAAGEVALSASLAAIDQRITEIDRSLAKDFPEYAVLASPKPLDTAEVQALLREDEALVVIIDTEALQPTPEESFIWVITKANARWVRIARGTKALSARVRALRCGLDHTLWYGDGAAKCAALLKASPVEEEVNGHKVQVLPFDLVRAHGLFKVLLGPVEEMIQGKHLLIVPSGPLTSLPFSVLVTAPPKSAIASKLVDYREAAWLGTRQPITVLPSVASLKVLRQYAKTSRATKPYLGIGNPLLDGPQDDPRWGVYYKKQAQTARDKQQCTKTMSQRLALAATRPLAGLLKLFRGPNADIEEVRRWPPLPETADELCEVGRQLGVPESEIVLGARATETTLKKLSEQGRLTDYAILHFATHGALTGQVQGSAEPGLILTPPDKGTTDPKALERDDGFLTASEIGILKLDADWVVLSACNTAGGQGENAEALSGLARAFFYAGARALLVSHWEVGSDAAVKLTTRAFAQLKAHPKIGRAEAFRLSMRELIEKGTPAEAHPSIWAPFIVVGEGAGS
jgi:CHAT domain-containing protein/tetratricopeptide (TPR) repeat protein